MPPQRGAKSGQVPRRSTRRKTAAPPEPVPDHPGTISQSPTPVWSGGSNPGHSDAVDQQTELQEPRHPEYESEEDEFMPATQEVAATLVAMRSRRSDVEIRGHEVRRMEFKYRQ